MSATATMQLSPATTNTSVRKRSACDRCHGQKLRCIRQPGTEVCARCAKARAECIYSPANRVLRPETKQSHATTNTPQQSLDSIPTPAATHIPLTPMGVAMPNDWFLGQPFTGNYDDFEMPDLSSVNESSSNISSLPSWYNSSTSASSVSSVDKELNLPTDREFNFSTYLEQNVRPELQLTHTIPKVNNHNKSTRVAQHRQLPSSDGPLPSMTASVRQLSELSVKLAELVAAIPPVCTPPQQPCDGFKISDLYASSQKLLHIYPIFLKNFTQIERLRTAQTDLRTTKGASPTVCGIPDLASVHLLLSCHHRLMDLYQLMVEYMNQCINDGFLPPPDQPVDTACDTNFRIGDFQPTEQIAIVMQFAMITEYARQSHESAEQICDVLESTIGQRVSTAQSSPQSVQDDSSQSCSSYQGTVNIQADATITSCRHVKERAAYIHKTLDDMRLIIPKVKFS